MHGRFGAAVSYPPGCGLIQEGHQKLPELQRTPALADRLAVAAGGDAIAGVELIQAQFRIAGRGGVHHIGPQRGGIGG